MEAPLEQDETVAAGREDQLWTAALMILRLWTKHPQWNWQQVKDTLTDEHSFFGVDRVQTFLTNLDGTHPPQSLADLTARTQEAATKTLGRPPVIPKEQDKAEQAAEVPSPRPQGDEYNALLERDPRYEYWTDVTNEVGSFSFEFVYAVAHAFLSSGSVPRSFADALAVPEWAAVFGNYLHSHAGPGGLAYYPMMCYATERAAQRSADPTVSQGILTHYVKDAATMGLAWRTDLDQVTALAQSAAGPDEPVDEGTVIEQVLHWYDQEAMACLGQWYDAAFRGQMERIVAIAERFPGSL